MENFRDTTARKFPNKIELLSADLINVWEDLTSDIDPIFEITEYLRYTEINNCLNGKIVNSLIDTGSIEQLKMLINTEAKNIKITVNDISDTIQYNMMSFIESKQYSSLNSIECLDGENDHISLRSKTNFEFQDCGVKKFDVSIEEIEQETLNINECLDGENDHKSLHWKTNFELQD